MGTVPSQYIVMQQAEWAGRKFYTAHDQRAGRVVYLMQEPVRGRRSSPQHPSLPRLQPLVVDDDAGWFIAAPSKGETLEDLRTQGRLSEQDMLIMLLSVADALAALGAQQPPLAPSYLDPAAIKRDALGRWVLDYLVLAQAPEARKASAPPPGIYAFGVLLYWLFTGQAARMSRVQVGKVGGVAPALQFIMIRCLGRSYPSMAELRTDMERSGREGDFRGVVRLIAKRLPDAPGAPEKPVPQAPKAPLEYRTLPLGGPQIPVDDRPWALPARPEDGFRQYVVAPPPDPVKQKLYRAAAATLAGLAALTLGGWTVLKVGLVPDAALPISMRAKAKPVGVQYPHVARANAEVGRDLLPAPGTGPALVPTPAQSEWDEPRELLERKRVERDVRDSAPVVTTAPESVPPNPVTPPAATMPPPPQPTVSPPQPTQPAPTPTPAPTPRAAATPVPVPAPQLAWLEPMAPEPAFFAVDARTGAVPMQTYIDGQAAGKAYVFPHPTALSISLQSFNYLFSRNVYWVPADGATVRLFSGGRSLLTDDFTIVEGRLWLQLSPTLQESLGVQISAYSDSVIHFTLKQ